jgi:hypothetical protein
MRASAIGLVVALAFVPTAAFAQAGPPGGPGGPPPESQGGPPSGSQGGPPPEAPGGPTPGAPSGPPPGAPSGPPPGGPGGAPRGAISRDQFVQQRAEAAGRLFDQIDVNHTGYITRAQLRAFMAQRRGGARGSGGPPPQQ